MISIELHLPTISLVSFICLLLPIVPAAFSLLLCICHYSDGLQVIAGILSGCFILHIISLLLCGLFPKRPITLIFDFITLIGVLSSGCVWGSKRLSLSTLPSPHATFEIILFTFWAVTLLISTSYLTIAITETIISINQSNKQHQQLNEKLSHDTVLTASTLFSTPTTGYEIRTPSQDELSTPPLTDLTISNTGNFNYIPAQYTANYPSQIDSSTIGSTINSEPMKTIKKHKSSNSFLSFFASSETINSPKPTIKAHHKSDSLLGKLSHQMKNSVTTIRSSTSHGTITRTSNNINQYQFHNSQNHAAFDGWEINSLGIKDRLEWSLNQMDNNSTIQQSRNVSGTSKLTTSTYASNFNNKINRAGFTRDARSLMAYKGLQSNKRVPSDPGSWKLPHDDSLTDEHTAGTPSMDEPLAQYDRERLSNLSC